MEGKAGSRAGWRREAFLKRRFPSGRSRIFARPGGRQGNRVRPRFPVRKRALLKAMHAGAPLVLLSRARARRPALFANVVLFQKLFWEEIDMKLGVVGLPNVGKSTLFNAITCAGAQAANYPFCTIEPNTGVVAVPDARLDVLAEMYHPE